MADLTFKINGADYPIENVGQFIGSLTIDECGVYHQWTGDLIENIADATITSLMVASFMQIAYMRGNPGISPQVARQAVGESNLVDALSAFNAVSEDDARPPAMSASEPAQNERPANRPASPRSSGDGSTTSSETPANGRQDSGSQLWELYATSGSPRSDS